LESAAWAQERTSLQADRFVRMAVAGHTEYV
jgi:hypothetical protein